MDNEIMDMEETIEDTSTDLVTTEDNFDEESVETSSMMPGIVAGAVIGIVAVKGIPAAVKLGKKAFTGAKEKVSAFVEEKKNAKKEESKDNHVVIEETKDED